MIQQSLDPVSANGVAPTEILVVEDESIFARAVCKRLRKAGFSCASAATLAQARQALTEQLPQLILLDMRLPDGSGLDLLQQLRTKSANDIAVIVLTAYGEIEDAVTAMKHGAVDYLRKPVDLDTLLHTVEQSLAHKTTNVHAADIEQPKAQSLQLLGESPPIRTVREQIERIGRLSTQTHSTPPTVLILGEYLFESTAERLL